METNCKYVEKYARLIHYLLSLHDSHCMYILPAKSTRVYFGASSSSRPHTPATDLPRRPSHWLPAIAPPARRPCPTLIPLPRTLCQALAPATSTSHLDKVLARPLGGSVPPRSPPGACLQSNSKSINSRLIGCTH
jgi:hypothetical protein